MPSSVSLVAVGPSAHTMQRGNTSVVWLLCVCVGCLKFEAKSPFRRSSFQLCNHSCCHFSLKRFERYGFFFQREMRMVSPLMAGIFTVSQGPSCKFQQSHSTARLGTCQVGSDPANGDRGSRPGSNYTFEPSQSLHRKAHFLPPPTGLYPHHVPKTPDLSWYMGYRT